MVFLSETVVITQLARGEAGRRSWYFSAKRS
jgi:hypothetical protein